MGCVCTDSESLTPHLLASIMSMSELDHEETLSGKSLLALLCLPAMSLTKQEPGDLVQKQPPLSLAYLPSYTPPYWEKKTVIYI